MIRRDALRLLGASAALPLVPNAIWAEEEGPTPGATIIPFTLKGHHGTVAVTYGVTEDPVKSGFDVVPGMNMDIRACRGYPTMQGIVQSYEGTGYRKLCGWMQIITGKSYHTVGDQGEPADTSRSIDKFPSMMDLDLPFASLGTLPGVFDAPCHNLNGGYAELRWTADTFLTTVPLRTRDEDIQRLAGFRWGYTEYADPARHPPAPFPLTVTGADAWNDLLPYLKKTFPNWRFAAG